MRKKLLFLGAFALTTAFSTLSSSCIFNKEYQDVRITKIFDGDTFEIVSKNKREKIRLYGIDTPETKKANTNVAILENHYALLAKSFVTEIIKQNKNKKIELNVQTVDKYNRLVAVLKIGQIDISKELLKRGLARKAYISINKNEANFKLYGARTLFQKDYYYQLDELEKYAKRHKIGFWKENIQNVFHKLN
ncbi:thermonuclease family protein [Mycoplasmopsis hyopharyngis]|uniref:thermonuclease family protein n=1 Tax=Mycoplasmopsis hyopharyngis TaxID=29558 RepID=UPI0038732D40